MALFVAPLLIAGCSDNSGPSGPTFPAQQTGTTDGGLTFALSARPGPGADQFIITLVLTSGAGGAGGRPVPNEPVTFTGGKLNPTRTVTDANGTATSVLTCDGVTSPVTVVALFGGTDPADAAIDVPCGGVGGASAVATGGGATTLPTVTITATGPADDNPVAPGTFTVTSSSPAPAGGLVVSFVVGGTAMPVATCPAVTTGAEDYTPILSGTVTIPAGATSATITVTPCADLFAEGGETVVVTLTAAAGYTVGTPGTATVTIND